MPETVLVGEREYGKGAAVFSQNEGFRYVATPGDEAALSAAVRREQARAVVVGMHLFTGALYEALHEVAGDSGSIIARFGVGHENVDKAQARAHGCVVANTPGALDVSVAEHTLWLIGALTRRLPAVDTAFRAGEWMTVTGVELAGKSLGLIGFGRIAQRVAAIAHFGFGMRVRAAGTSSPAEWSERHGEDLTAVQRTCGLESYTDNADEVLASSDFISLHLPGSPSNRHFLDAKRLALMRPSSVLVNTARGSVVDENALYDALSAGALAGAALDVFEREPYVPASTEKDLRTLPNVLLTPHVASNTAEANRRIAEACVANLRHFFAGEHARISVVH